MMHRAGGFTAGAWDLLHPGHLIFLESCRALCDRLTVYLQTDPSLDRPLKNRPAQSVLERYIQLKACRHVDDVIPYETESDLERVCQTTSLSKRFLGSDYREQPVVGKSVCLSRGIEIVYIDRLHDFSSSSLRDRICHEISRVPGQRWSDKQAPTKRSRSSGPVEAQ